MLSKRGGVTAIFALLSFLSVAWITGCQKQGNNKYSCEGVVCLNGGSCDSAQCTCPTGFEGANCSIAIADKYIGTWNARQIIIGTDSLQYLNDTTYFKAFLKYSSTSTTFFFDNFNGDASYNQVVCSIDSPGTLAHTTFDSSTLFVIDTTSGFSMEYGHYRLLSGSGSFQNNSITGTYIVMHTNGTVNFETDTVSFLLTPQ